MSLISTPLSLSIRACNSLISCRKESVEQWDLCHHRIVMVIICRTLSVLKNCKMLVHTASATLSLNVRSSSTACALHSASILFLVSSSKSYKTNSNWRIFYISLISLLKVHFQVVTKIMLTNCKGVLTALRRAMSSCRRLLVALCLLTSSSRPPILPLRVAISPSYSPIWSFKRSNLFLSSAHSFSLARRLK